MDGLIIREIEKYLTTNKIKYNPNFFKDSTMGYGQLRLEKDLVTEVKILDIRFVTRNKLPDNVQLCRKTLYETLFYNVYVCVLSDGTIFNYNLITNDEKLIVINVL